MRLLINIIVALVIVSGVVFLIKQSYNTSSYSSSKVIELEKHLTDSIDLDKLKVGVNQMLVTCQYDTISLNQLRNKGIKYVLMVSRASCFSCIKDQISMLEMCVDNNEIAVAISNMSIRSVIQYKQTHNSKLYMFAAEYQVEIENEIAKGGIITELNDNGEIIVAKRMRKDFYDSNKNMFCKSFFEN